MTDVIKLTGDLEVTGIDETTGKLILLSNVTGQTQDALDNSGKATKEYSSNLGDLGDNLESTLKKVMAFGVGTLTVKAAFDELKQAVDFVIQKTSEYQSAEVATDAALEATRGAAGETSTTLREMADTLQNMSGVEASTILHGESLMLTFRDIGQDVFPEAMKAALNMSAALGGDLQGTVIQLGKALEDPVQGLTALRRVGVSFSSDQQDMIKSMEESGNLMGAQKMILQELADEFGGQASASLLTYQGSVDRVKTSMDDLAIAMGNKVMPVVTDFNLGMADSITELTQFILLGGMGADSQTSLGKVLQAHQNIMDGYTGQLFDANGAVKETIPSYIAQAQAIQKTSEQAKTYADISAMMKGKILDIKVPTDTLAVSDDVLAQMQTKAKDALKATGDALDKYQKDMENADKAARAYATGQNDLAVSLKNATATQLAQSVISKLTKDFQDRLIDLSTYNTEVKNLELAYGMTTPAAEAMAAGQGILTTAFEAGIVPIQNHKQAILDLKKASESGKPVDMVNLLEKNGATPAQAAETMHKSYIQQTDAKADVQSPQQMTDNMKQASDLYAQYEGKMADPTLVAKSASNLQLLIDEIGLLDAAIGAANNQKIVIHTQMDYSSSSVKSGMTGTESHPQKDTASGIDYIVPPGHEHDSWPVNAQTGERVIVQPANVVAQGGGVGGMKNYGSIQIVVQGPMDANALLTQLTAL